MPVYTYRCDNCGVQFERHQSFSDQPLSWCPECSKKTLRKVYTPVRIVFKGSGFYATDHKSPSGGGKLSPSSKTGEEAKTELKDKPEKAEKTVKKESSPQSDEK